MGCIVGLGWLLLAPAMRSCLSTQQKNTANSVNTQNQATRALSATAAAAAAAALRDRAKNTMQCH
jgi:hypothetical protein